MPILRVQSAVGNLGAPAATATFGATPTIGDQLITFLTSNTAAATHSMPAGWRLLRSFDRVSPTESLTVWLRTAGVAEPTAVIGSATGAGNTTLAILEYSGLTVDDPAHGLSPFDWFAERISVGTVMTLECGPVIGTRAPNELWLAVLAGGGVSAGLAWTNGFVTVQAAGRIGVAEKIVAGRGDADSVPTWTSPVNLMGAMFTFADVPLENQFEGWGVRV